MTRPLIRPDVESTGERAEKLDALFESITPDASLPRCGKCGSLVTPGEMLCLACSSFAQKDREEAVRRRRRARPIGPYMGGFRR